MTRKDEYSALRGEMLQRLGNLYDAQKYGIGSILVALGYLMSHKEIVPWQGLAIVEALIIVWGLFSIKEFRGIYRLGTYIAVFCESTDGPKWHRMGRRHEECLAAVDEKQLEGSKPFPGRRWGADSTQLAIVFGFLTLLAWAITLNEAKAELQIQSLFPAVLLIGVVAVCVWLVNVENKRKQTEAEWLRTRDAWGKVYNDPYEPSRNTLQPSAAAKV